MKPFLSFLIVPFFVVSGWGCGPWGGDGSKDAVAWVGGESITLDEFNQEFRELVLEPGKETDPGNQPALKEACLDQMIERRLLVQEARRVGIRVSPEELDHALQEIKRDYPERDLDERLNLKGMTLDGLKTRMEEKLLAEKMVRAALQYRAEVHEKEALDYYESHRSTFRLSAEARVRQIVVADGEEAIQILKRLKKGENFEKLAREKSLGPEKVDGGNLGSFRKGERPEEFDRVFAMERGAVSEVIKSPYGYHIFKVVEKSEPRSIPFEEARSGILQELKRKKGEEEYQSWLKDLKAKSKMKINRKRLNS
jgi:parvulin-like peptidyl-prolyl isomerase